MDAGKMLAGHWECRYITYSVWSELDFQYDEYVIHAGRSNVTAKDLHNPPLQIVTSERVM